MVSIRAVPVSLNPRTPVMIPREAITVPPGTPGAPKAKIPRSRQNRTIVPGAGMYQTVYYLFTSDTQQALSSLVGTIGAAGAIAIAIFIVDALVAVVKRIVL